jgi:hypothetical protein
MTIWFEGDAWYFMANSPKKLNAKAKFMTPDLLDNH